MNVNIQISDSVYQALMTSGRRVQGSLALASPTEGNFNAHRRSDSLRPDTKFIKLAHGRASMSDERVSLTLRIDRRETDIEPHEVIDIESCQASDFIFANS